MSSSSHLFVPLTVAAAIVALGCSRASNADPDFTEALRGTWSASCALAPGKTDLWKVESRAFNGNNFAFTSVDFTDAACTTKKSSDLIAGSFHIGAFTSSESLEINLTVTSVFLTLHTSEVAQDHNLRAVCGGGFQAGKRKSLSLDSCSDGDRFWMPKMFDLFGAAAESIRFGEISEGLDRTTAEKRPQALSTLRIYTKVPR